MQTVFSAGSVEMGIVQQFLNLLFSLLGPFLSDDCLSSLEKDQLTIIFYIQVNASLVFFLFSFQVHEKSILICAL